MTGSAKKLSDVCERIVDCEHKTAPTQPTGYPSIRTPNIGRGRLIRDGVNRVSEETYSAWTRRAEPQEDDLILAREAPVGNVAIVPPGAKVCLGQRTVLLRPDKRQVNPLYLVYLLLGDEIQGKFRSLSTGATVGHLNVGDIRSLPLPELPSLDVQIRIADVLSAYDDLIENNTKRIQILEEMARSLYREWFVHFRFPGHESVAMVESERGPIPDGWEVRQLGQLADVNARSIRPGEGRDQIAYVDIAAVSTGSVDQIRLLPFAEAPSRARRIAQDGDIIWSTVRPNRKSYSLILDPPLNLVVSTGFAVISATDAPFTYLYCAITTEEFTQYLVNRTTGAAYPAVNASVFNHAFVVRPPESLVTRFHELTEPGMRLSACLSRKNDKLRTTRDLLLPKLVSGEIDVSEIDVGVAA